MKKAPRSISCKNMLLLAMLFSSLGSNAVAEKKAEKGGGLNECFWQTTLGSSHGAYSVTHHRDDPKKRISGANYDRQTSFIFRQGQKRPVAGAGNFEVFYVVKPERNYSCLLNDVLLLEQDPNYSKEKNPHGSRYSFTGVGSEDIADLKNINPQVSRQAYQSGKDWITSGLSFDTPGVDSSKKAVFQKIPLYGEKIRCFEDQDSPAKTLFEELITEQISFNKKHFESCLNDPMQSDCGIYKDGTKASRMQQNVGSAQEYLRGIQKCKGRSAAIDSAVEEFAQLLNPVSSVKKVEDKKGDGADSR